jgi:hypothetical protein
MVHGVVGADQEEASVFDFGCHAIERWLLLPQSTVAFEIH